MKLSHYSCCLTALIFILLTGCEQKEESVDVLFEQLIKAPTGHFRGIEIGYSPDQVKEMEGVAPINELDEELGYVFDFAKMDSSRFEVVYAFDELGLFDIQVDLYLEDYEMAGQLFQKLRDHFDGKYGTSTIDSGYTTWVTKSTRQHEIEISLIDEGKEYGFPFLSLTFHEKITDAY